MKGTFWADQKDRQPRRFIGCKLDSNYQAISAVAWQITMQSIALDRIDGSLADAIIGGRSGWRNRCQMAAARGGNSTLHRLWKNSGNFRLEMLDIGGKAGIIRVSDRGECHIQCDHSIGGEFLAGEFSSLVS